MAIWYRQGAASVENGATSVTGTLTGWLNQVKPGDGITFDDGCSWYEIAAEPVSNTALVLATPYAGETVSGAAYAIDRRSPQWSLASDLAVKVAALLGKITTLLLTNGKPNDGIGNDGAIAFDSGAQLFYFKSGGEWDEGTSLKGDGGWSPVFALASDGERRVLQVVDWVGGESEKPPVDLYVGVSGLTETIGEAADVRGAQGVSGDDGSDGADGNDGWSPILAAIADSDRRVFRVVDWVGGEGTKPAAGKYLGPSGLVDAVGDGTDVRGPAGSGAGDVVGPGATVIAGEIAVFSDTTGEAIEGAGVTIGAIGAAIAGKMDTITEALALPEVEDDPETPSAGTKLLYAKDDGKVYTKNSAGAVVEVGAGAAGGREVLTANRTYYVRTDGSDSNNGLSNTSGGAFLTIQKAIDTVAGLDLGIYTVTISVGAGTFTGANILKKLTGAGSAAIKGAGATTIVSVSSGNCFYANGGVLNWLLEDMKMAAPAGSAIVADNFSYITFANVEFGAVSSSGRHLYATGGAKIEATGNYTISGGGQIHALATWTGQVAVVGRAVTLSGTPVFPTAFVYASRLGKIEANGITFSGSATGPRYLSDNNSIVFTNGGGANYFPGNAAGSVTSGGIYS